MTETRAIQQAVRDVPDLQVNTLEDSPTLSIPAAAAGIYLCFVYPGVAEGLSRLCRPCLVALGRNIVPCVLVDD